MKLRRDKPDAKRTYRVPLYPFVPILATVSGVFVIINQIFLAGTKSTLLSVGSIIVTLIGIPVYLAVQKLKKA